eukprot:8986916-Pyramimonas_sp.AAC.1
MVVCSSRCMPLPSLPQIAGPLPAVSGALCLWTGPVLVMPFVSSRVLLALSAWLTPMGLLWL